MHKVITIKNLKKSYGDIKAVDDISFEVEQGSLFAFLGLNGAGKSTTINIISTLLKKDAGKVDIMGYDLDTQAMQIRDNIGIVFQGSILDANLSVRDNLRIRGAFYGYYGDKWKRRLDELTNLLSLDDILSRPYGKLSGGQRRRVDIARGLINSPKILILDEPTTGLDPMTRKTVWEVVDKIRKEQNMTVFLTTHYMEEANTADDVVIIDAGKIAARGTPVQLKNKYSRDYLIVYSDKNDQLDKAFEGLDYEYDGAYKVVLSGSKQAKELLAKYGKMIEDFEVVKGDMDDVFLNVTGKKLSGGGEQ